MQSHSIHLHRHGLLPQRLPTPPGGRGLPLLGETFAMLRGLHDFIESRHAKYGPIFVARVFGKPTVFMRGAEAMRWIYAGEGDYVESEWPLGVRKLFGADSTVLLTGPEHRARRKLLIPQLKRSTLAGWIPQILGVARRHIEQWAAEAEGGPLTILPRMRALSLEITAGFVLGDIEQLGVPLRQLSHELDLWIAGMFVPVPFAIPGSTFARAMAARKRIFTVLGELVERRAAAPERGPDLLSALLEVRDERGEGLSLPSIVDELLLLLFGGNDTTLTTSVNVVYHLCMHPEVAARARAEQEVLGGQGLTLERVRAMTYLEATIKESMRLLPLGGGFRTMRKDGEFGGFRIPKGWRVAAGPHTVHFEAEYYPEPHRFRPERWLAEDRRPPFTFIAFGGGPRTCLGMHFAMLQMQLVIGMLLREYELELVPGQDLSFKEIPTPTLRSGLLVELRQRLGAEPEP
jgi:retinoid hydroxylase